MYEIIAHADEVTNDGFFDSMMGGHSSSNDGYSILWMFLFMTVIAILVIMFFSFISKNGRDSQASDEEVLKILKNRYAKGEISKKEFETMKKDIK